MSTQRTRSEQCEEQVGIEDGDDDDGHHYDVESASSSADSDSESNDSQGDDDNHHAEDSSSVAALSIQPSREQKSQKEQLQQASRRCCCWALIPAEATLDVLVTMFDGCRVFENSLHRHYSTVELTIATVVAIISGSRPTQHCNTAAFAIGALAIVGLLYVIVIRPFRTKLDAIFSIINNLLLVVLSVSVAVTLERQQQEQNTNENDGASTAGISSAAAEKAMQVSLWLITIVAFVQLVVQGYWAYHVQQQRHLAQQRQQQRESFKNGADALQALAFPALYDDAPLLTPDTHSEKNKARRENSNLKKTRNKRRPRQKQSQREQSTSLSSSVEEHDVELLGISNNINNPLVAH